MRYLFRPKKYLPVVLALSAFLFPLAFSVLLTQRSYAQCQPAEELYAKTRANFDLDLRRTTDNLVNATEDVAFSKVTGYEVTKYANCGAYVSSNFSNCNATPQAECQAMTNQFGYLSDPDAFSKFARSQVSGSLLGIAYAFENYNTYEPVPVNLALFWNDSAGRLPFVGKALAQTVNYRQPFINEIYDAWKMIRNLSFAIMAIIFLVIGILIITRRRINQQVVVNVQYAIPRVVLALFLIAFSYPIGSVLASVAWSLGQSATTIVNSLMGPPAWQTALSNAGAGAVLILLVAAAAYAGWITAGAGWAIVIAVCVVVVGLLVYLQIRVFILYLQMLFSILTSPIEFAIGAIPGSENRIFDWFRKMFMYGITIFAMQGTIALVNRIGASILLSTAHNITGGWLLVAFGSIFVFIYGYGLAISMPGKVKSWVMGEQKGRRQS